MILFVNIAFFEEELDTDSANIFMNLVPNETLGAR